MLVRVAQNRGRCEEFGAERWTVEWWTLRPGVDDSGPESPDPDSDFITHYAVYPTRERAESNARKIVDEGASYWGHAVVQRETVDWLSEDDGIAEWTAAGQPIYVDGE